MGVDFFLFFGGEGMAYFFPFFFRDLDFESIEAR